MLASFRPNRYSSVYLFLLLFGYVCLHQHTQPLYIPLSTLNCCVRTCAVLPAPVFPRDFFDQLKSLLLFTTFQTSTLAYALRGGHHISFALIGRCYLPPAFSFRVPMLVRYSAFVTKVQCGLPSRLFPTYARCRYRCFVPVSHLEECPVWRFTVTLSISLPSLIAVCYVCIVSPFFWFCTAKVRQLFGVCNKKTHYFFKICKKN